MKTGKIEFENESSAFIEKPAKKLPQFGDLAGIDLTNGEDPTDYIRRLRGGREAESANAPLVNSDNTQTILNLEKEVERLRVDKKELQRQLAHKDSVLREKNLMLDALGYVWCSGGCRGGAFRFTKVALTEHQVEMVEVNTKRLRAWFENTESRKLPLELVSEKPNVYRRVSVESLTSQVAALEAENGEKWIEIRAEADLPEKDCAFYLVTYKHPLMERGIAGEMFFNGGKWREQSTSDEFAYDVIAWRNLPQPFRAGCREAENE